MSDRCRILLTCHSSIIEGTDLPGRYSHLAVHHTETGHRKSLCFGSCYQAALHRHECYRVLVQSCWIESHISYLPPRAEDEVSGENGPSVPGRASAYCLALSLA